MGFCKECGHLLKSGERFCQECGTEIALEANDTSTEQNVLTESETAVASPERSSREEQHFPRQKWTLKKKLTLLTTVIIIILLFTGYKFGSAMTSKEKAIEHFQTALNQNDSNALQKLLFSSDPNLKINHTNLKPLIAYLKANPEEKKVFVKTAKAQSSLLDSSSSAYPYSGTAYEQSPFILKKHGKTLMLFDHYQFEINPFYLTLSTNYNKADLYVNGKKVAQANSDDYSKKVGPYILGIYHTESRLKNTYADLTHKEDIVLDGSEGQKVDSDLDLEGDYFTLDNQTGESGTLILNGKSTKLDLNSVDKIGPLNMDGSTMMQIAYNLPWGKVTSEPVAIDSNTMTLNDLPVSDDQKQNIIQILSDYEKSWAETQSTRSIGKLKNVSPSFKDKTAENLQMMKDNEEFWSGKFIQGTYDLDSFSLSNNDQGDYIIECLGKTDYSEATYYAGEKPSLEDNEDYNTYSLIYDSNKKNWTLDSIDGSWNDLSNHVQTVKNDDSKTKTNADGKIDQTALKLLIDNYETDLIEAINQGDFTPLEGDLTSGSALYNDQKKLVETLYNKGITESLESYDVKDIKGSKNNFLIDVDEAVTVTGSDGKSTLKTYKWEYTAEGSDGTYTLSNITAR